jgi:hypothetical protein
MEKQLGGELEVPENPLAKMSHKLQTPHARILLCFIGGTFVWATYLLFVYSLTSLTCYWGWFMAPEGYFGLGLKITQIVATVIALGIIAYFGFVAFKEWMRAGIEGNSEIGETQQARNPMLAFVTMLLNSLYSLIIVVSLLPIFMLPTCAK